MEAIGLFSDFFVLGSLSAIYERFTPAQIGCSLRTLWQSGLPKSTRLCFVSRFPVARKRQSNPKNEIR